VQSSTALGMAGVGKAVAVAAVPGILAVCNFVVDIEASRKVSEWSRCHTVAVDGLAESRCSGLTWVSL